MFERQRAILAKSPVRCLLYTLWPPTQAFILLLEPIPGHHPWALSSSMVSLASLHWVRKPKALIGSSASSALC